MFCRYEFPDPRMADPEGFGLIAIGGDLAPETLIAAYRQGLFPWFNEGEPIAWWSPEPRCVIYPHKFTPSKSLKRRIKTSPWQITLNHAFDEVINACASTPRQPPAPTPDPLSPLSSETATWISPAMIAAYQRLHRLGVAHSVEVWQDECLIGGLYGLKIGQAFFGESMFHRVTDASKVAFFALMRLTAAAGFAWVDCQLPNPHLMSLGAVSLPREAFLTQLSRQIAQVNSDWSALNHHPIAVARLLHDDLLQSQGNRLSWQPTNPSDISTLSQ